MKRLSQTVLIATFVAFSWLAMQCVHELGHVAGAWITGATIERVFLHPLSFSRTDLSSNPHPSFVSWAGAVIGATIPLLAFLLAHALRIPGVYLFRFFAAFCLVTNGLYLAVGSINGVGDSGDLLNCGSQRWHLIAFGIVTVPLGFYLCNGLGPKFGFGPTQAKVSPSATIVSAALFSAILIFEILLHYT